MEKKNINIGCSFDGLKDRYFISESRKLCLDSFFFSDVILPHQSGGKLLVGDVAERSRVASGFCWPPESQVSTDKNFHLRRIPVSWAWRVLIDSKDKFARWKVATGVSFSVSKIIASHIAGALGPDKKENVAVTIPDHLDEYGQESLIKDLKLCGVGSPVLIWKSISAALSWLEELGPKLGTISKKDIVIIGYFGPDSIEFTALHMREKTYKNKKFIIPLREPPRAECPLCGCDWVAEFIQKTLNTDNISTFWQVFTGFPEPWEVLAHREWDRNQLPRVISTDEGWAFWEPSEVNPSVFWQLEPKPSKFLKELTKGCLPYEHNRDETECKTWAELIKKSVISLIESYADYRVRGLLLCGSLAPIISAPLIGEIIDTLKAHGINLSLSEQPAIDSIWIPSTARDILAEGAAIYRSRLERSEPTYLDTLKQLYIYAEKREYEEWIPLLSNDQLEVEGGQLYHNVLRNKFILKRNSKTLEVLLKKTDSASFKKAHFQFAYAPDEDMPIDTKICVASAGGLAQVELVPNEKEFLGGQQVFLDYSLMQETTILPPRKLGFPPIVPIEVDPNDQRITSAMFHEIATKFLSTDLAANNYCRCVGELREQICSSVNFFQTTNNKWMYGRIVDQDGKTKTKKGQAIIDNISKKLGADLKRILARELKKRTETEINTYRLVFAASTWLYGAAPRETINHLRVSLDTNGASVKSRVVHAAGRCLTMEEDIKLFYLTAVKRITSTYYTKKFPIQWSGAIYRMLLFRQYAADMLDKTQAELFVDQIENILEECVNQRNFKMKFLQAARTFLYVLRFRIKDELFLPKGSREFERIIKFLKSAQLYLKRMGQSTRNARVAELILGIEKYMNYEGSANIVSLIDELFGDEGKESDDTDDE